MAKAAKGDEAKAPARGVRKPPAPQADRDEQIRRRAYQLWEAAGRPHGQADEHWDQARREVKKGGSDASRRAAPTKSSNGAAGRPAAAARSGAAGAITAGRARQPRAQTEKKT